MTETIDVSDLKRRPSLLEPGVGLLLGESSVHTSGLIPGFAAVTGVDGSKFVVSPLCSVPLPAAVVVDGSTPAPPRRLGTVNPVALWHPLLWLPNHIASRMPYTDPSDGVVKLESHDAWAARVAMELQVSGLYDPKTGTWLDIMDVIGLDVANDFDLARMQDWLDGRPDDLLDALSLDEFFPTEPAQWAFDVVHQIEELLLEGSWALDAAALYDQLIPATFGEEFQKNAERVRTVSSVLTQALRLLNDADSAVEERLISNNNAVDPTMNAAGYPNGGFFGQLSAKFSGPSVTAQTLDDVADHLLERIYLIREAYWPMLDELMSGGEDSAPSAQQFGVQQAAIQQQVNDLYTVAETAPPTPTAPGKHAGPGPTPPAPISFITGQE